MSNEAVIDSILSSADESSKSIQTPVLNDEQVDLNHLLRIYQMIKKKLWAIGSGVIITIFGLSAYMVYSTVFKDKTTSELNKLATEIQTIKQEINRINSVCKINANNVLNMQYRFNTMQNFKDLEIEIHKLKNTSK